MQDVEDLHPLSPLQEGLLFHTLSDPDSRMYFNQTLATLVGELDESAFRRAWALVVEHHPVLRSFFVWEGVERPVQVVKRSAEMPIEVQDWRGCSAEQREERIEALRRADLARGFDLSQPPLMRAVLIRTADDSHDLFWSFHHILMDGWSMFQVLGQVFAAYDALAEGKTFEIKSPRPYRDYIRWLKQQSLSRAESFWRENLAGFTAPTALPVDTSPHDAADADGEDFASLAAYLSSETTAALAALASKHHLTLNTILQASWALLLSRASGEEDVLFGAVVSGRPPELDGVESMVGLFINSLPVRVRAPADAQLLPWLTDLQASQAALRDYEYSPLVEVQGWSDVPRGTPLFKSLFLFENYHKDTPLEEMCRSLEIRDVHWYERHNFPIAAMVIPGAEQLELRIIHQTEHYSTSAVERMLDHWRTLLDGMVADPEARLADLPWLTTAEWDQLVTGWNDTDAELPDACVHELFEAAADRTPDATAVVHAGGSLSYRELDERSNRLAHRLAELGVGRGSLVAICTGRTLEMVVGMLATLKAGGAYVPLDSGLPAERLRFMFTDADVRAVLTCASVAESLPAHDAETLVLDTDWESIASQSPARPAPTATPRDLAYMIYTSGSTGRPKGVELEHVGLVNLITWHQRAYDVGPEDRATHLAGLGFDASVWELWPYLTAGASLHLVDDEARLNPEALLRFFREHAITQAFVPTPLAEALLEHEIPDDLPLEILLTGGDKLKRAPEHALPFRLVNHYGPTENTVVATAMEVVPDPLDDRAPSIGRPIQNVRCYLLDRTGRPVPIGVPGEIFIGGRSLCRGYHARPDLTAAAFVPNPFASGERLYATGDMGRWRPDGCIDFLGRQDHQVKVRGYRIELGEIEVCLARHPAVNDAAVMARQDTPGVQQLVAYVTCSLDSKTAAAELRAFLKDQLPDYMVPTIYVCLQSFPLSPSGKVDRRALPAPEPSRPELETAYAAPADEIERAIAGIWQQTLGLDQVGVHDNFFDLGGHSLHLIRVHGRLKEDLGRDIPIVDLFTFPTVSALAAHLGSDPAKPEPLPADDSKQRMQAGRKRVTRLAQRRKRRDG